MQEKMPEHMPASELNLSCARLQSPELLAPAGGLNQLKAAIRFGADAVYLACERFGMRARADNFALEEMPRIVQYAHNHQVAVHVTLNTLMDAHDIKLLPAYLEQLASAGVDQFIIADAGAFSLAQKYAPNVELCMSTQASIMNAQAARFWHDMGAKRVVCAREMSLDDIADMRAQCPKSLEIEAFVHGAMCVAYSGRCLLSAAMTGRSGNKGACAQSCRWSYALVEEQRPGQYFPLEETQKGSYVLNAQDLCMIEYLEALKTAGVDSFKIEGRNKQAFYVATVVGAYRSVLDGGSVEAAARELCTISHRPYSTGFYFGNASQTLERDGYIKECLHVATVEDCVALANDRWQICVRCHNRFEPGDTLGVVSPYKPPSDIVVGPLQLHVPHDGGRPFVERPDLDISEVRKISYLLPVDVANRTKEHYIFELDRSLVSGDYLRRDVGV